MKRLIPVGLFALVFTLFLASTPEAQVRLKRGFTTVTNLLLGDGSASVPSLAFTNDPDTGLYSAAAGSIGFTQNGAESPRFAGGDVNLRSGAEFGFGSVSAPDLYLGRTAAGVFHLRNSGTGGIKFQFVSVPSITTNGITGEGFGGGASVLTGSTDTFGFIRVGAATEGVIAFATDWGTNLQQGCTANNEDGTPTYVQVTDTTMRLAGGTRAVPVAWTSASVVNWICGGAR